MRFQALQGLLCFVMIGRDHRMPVDMRRAFDHPIACLLMFVTTIVTDPIDHFSICIFPGCYAQHFFALIPQTYFPAAFVTLTVRVNRFYKPYPAFEAEGFVS